MTPSSSLPSDRLQSPVVLARWTGVASEGVDRVRLARHGARVDGIFDEQLTVRPFKLRIRRRR